MDSVLLPFEVLNSLWNDEVGLNLRLSFLGAKDTLESKLEFRFQNSDVYLFNGIPFGINGASYTLELAFHADDEDKLQPIISALKKWTPFERLEERFIIRTYNPVKGSVSLFFANGAHQTQKDFMRKFADYNPSVISEI